jgi:hypothetical protein
MDVLSCSLNEKQAPTTRSETPVYINKRGITVSRVPKSRQWISVEMNVTPSCLGDGLFMYRSQLTENAGRFPQN